MRTLVANKAVTHIKTGTGPKKKSKWVLFKNNIDLYLLLVPGLVFLILFKYTPMYGIVIAFQNFNIFKGIGGSPWVGLQNFSKLFSSTEFYQVFANTMLISIYKLVFLFPLPIFVAILLNEVRSMFFKRSVQTVIYLPHFLSWIVITGLFVEILSPSGGLINNILSWFHIPPISFMTDNRFFRSVLVLTAGWKESGWNAIIYIAAIAGIEQDLYEAADMDGAGRIRKIINITIPGILPTIIMLFILRLGHILDAGTEQILAMYNSLVYETGDVIGTYVYRMGLGKMDYSFGTAVGLFNSVVGLILVLSGNYLSRKTVQKSIW